MITAFPRARGRNRTARTAWTGGLLLAAALLVAGCVTDMTNSTIFGTATFRERMLLSPGSVLEVSVIEASDADASGKVIASERVEDLGAPPFHFIIPIRPSKIDERLNYYARAAILSDDTPIMSTDTAYPVLTSGASNEVDLVLRGTATAETASVTNLPATFVGILPCADCEGIEYHLDLLPESAYYLQRTYLGLSDNTVDRIGSWTANPATGTLAIWGQDEMPIRFGMTDGTTLRLLDSEGQPIESSLNYDLTRQPSFTPASLTLPLRGRYQYLADAAVFFECESGRQFSVAQEGDSAALERAYLEARSEPAQIMLVSLEGRLTMRPPMEGSGTVPTVVVDRFTGVWPTQTCSARLATSELRETNWVLSRLGDEVVEPGENDREPFFVLQAADNRVTGFGGCNDFAGDYSVSGTSIRLGPLAATLRACTEGEDIESRFLATLDAARRYRLYRNRLELFDSSENMIARLESRAPD